MTSADTFVDIFKMREKLEDTRLVDFVSETGRMEFFLLGSTALDSAKRVQRTLAKIIGYQNLPPYFSLGFHYCKWEK